MSRLTQSQGTFFAISFIASLFVAVMGLGFPARLASMFTWLVLPTMPAQFLGAIYAFSAFFMLGCLLARRQAEVRGAVQMIGIWTGMQLIISVLNLSAFDFNRSPVLIWFAANIIFPIVAIWMTVRNPEMMETADLPGPKADAWAKWFLLLQGILFTLLALLLFFFPAFMAALWPWTLTQVLAQMYAGPMLAYGLGSLLFSRQDTWIGIRAIVPGMVIFTDATLLLSLLHVDVFSFQSPAGALWFGWFAVATLVLLFMGFTAVQVRE